MKPSSVELSPWKGRQLVSVEGTPLSVLGSAVLPLYLDHTVFSTQIIVADGLTTEGVLGLDFLESNRCTIDTGRRVLQCGDNSISVSLCSSTEPQCAVLLSETIRIPSFSELEVMADTTGVMARGLGHSYLLEPIASTKLPVQAAWALVAPSASRIPVRLLNPSTQPVTVHKGTKIAFLEEADGLVISPVLDGGKTNVSSPSENILQEKRNQLWKMVQDAESELTETEADKLFQLLCSYADVFADSPDELGCTDAAQHQIYIGDSRPIRQPPRRIPAVQQEDVNRLLKNMQERDIIQPSNSPWASPIIMVKKKNGALRFCADYRKLNAVTQRDAYPLPRVDDALDTLAGCQWFTTLDLISGYWQVQLHPEDKQKTAFTTSQGLFEFNVVVNCNINTSFL